MKKTESKLVRLIKSELLKGKDYNPKDLQWLSALPQLIWDSNGDNIGTIPTELLENGYPTNGIPTSKDWNTLLQNITLRLQLIENEGWQTGDVKPSFNVNPMQGWIVLQDGTIGSATSGATIRANADTEALYLVLWNGAPQANCPVTGGRGSSASADFAANKPIALPATNGRTLVNGIGTYTNAETFGENTHILTIPEMPVHHHAGFYGILSQGGAGETWANGGSGQTLGDDHTTSDTGGGGAHENRQPSTAAYYHIKL